MSTYVGYLGPAGSNSYLACKELFDPINEDHDFLFVAQNSILKIIESLAENKIDIAVLPALSSSEGMVKDTIDTLLKDSHDLYRSGIRVIGSVKIPITFALLRKKNISSKMSEIQSIGIALQQCEVGLKKYAKVEKVPVASTSKAAKNAAKNDCIGAVAPEICAKLYRLDIVERNLQGEYPNYTKFYIMGNPNGHSFQDKNGRILISIQGSARNLKRFLDILTEYGFLIYEIYSKIEKPLDWLYTYVFEIDGRDDEIRFQHLTLALNQFKIKWKFMGCYHADTIPLQAYLKKFILLRKPVEIDRSKIDSVGIINYKIFSHNPVKSVQDVMDHLLILPEVIVKTVAYKFKDKIIFVSVIGDNEVDENKLEAVLGVPPVRANINEITNHGIEIGAISPLSVIAHKQIIDKKIFDIDKIYCGYEKRHLSIKLSSREFRRIPNHLIADVVID